MCRWAPPPTRGHTNEMMAAGPFNKLRMCVLRSPTHTTRTSRRYPFAGSTRQQLDTTRFDTDFFRIWKAGSRNWPTSASKSVPLHPYGGSDQHSSARHINVFMTSSGDWPRTAMSGGPWPTSTTCSRTTPPRTGSPLHHHGQKRFGHLLSIHNELHTTSPGHGSPTAPCKRTPTTRPPAPLRLRRRCAPTIVFNNGLREQSSQSPRRRSSPRRNSSPTMLDGRVRGDCTSRTRRRASRDELFWSEATWSVNHRLG